MNKVYKSTAREFKMYCSILCSRFIKDQARNPFYIMMSLNISNISFFGLFRQF